MLRVTMNGRTRRPSKLRAVNIRPVDGQAADVGQLHQRNDCMYLPHLAHVTLPLYEVTQNKQH